MADLLWLPPLNFGVNSTTIISQRVRVKILPDKELSKPFWAITLDVGVNFCGETGEPPIIMGLNYLSKPIIIPFHELNASSSMEDIDKFLFNKISQELSFHSRLCSTLSNSPFTTCSSKASSSPLEIKLCRWVADLLRISSIGGTDRIRIIRPSVTLKIRETISMKNEIHRGWLCWYNTSKKINIDFEKDYIAAISRPRTPEEIGCESIHLNREQALTAVLKDIDMNLDDKCCICLEELSVEKNMGGLKSLECGHIFHGDCIKKWLLPNIREDGRACPVCRRSLHSECTATLCPCI